jgi:GDP-4-dehydro-6-deoxy-D-mannose reductase
MKILVIGAGGFVGRHVCRTLSGCHEVAAGVHDPALAGNGAHYVNLLEPASVAAVLDWARPEAVVNCCGVIDVGEGRTNTAMSGNLLQAVLESGLDIRNVLLCGSAAVYGRVEPERLPVHETTPLNACSAYGQDKRIEEAIARLYRERFGLPVVVARLFNPVGFGMPRRMLLPSILRQLDQWRAGTVDRISVSRLDSARDYVSMADAAAAMAALATGHPAEFAYNLGTGKDTTTGELIQRVFALTGLVDVPAVVETSDGPETPAASQADIDRIHSEFGWSPAVPLDLSIREVLRGAF